MLPFFTSCACAFSLRPGEGRRTFHVSCAAMLHEVHANVRRSHAIAVVEGREPATS